MTDIYTSAALAVARSGRTIPMTTPDAIGLEFLSNELAKVRTDIANAREYIETRGQVEAFLVALIERERANPTQPTQLTTAQTAPPLPFSPSPPPAYPPNTRSALPDATAVDASVPRGPLSEMPPVGTPPTGIGPLLSGPPPAGLPPLPAEGDEPQQRDTDASRRAS